ncbi:MAG: outer membrane beta-barrel domain-containing protein [Myxococcales bacterium]|nr:outer membrane beta-barrel domain-containing protein [Myxococcales bacterium]
MRTTRPVYRSASEAVLLLGLLLGAATAHAERKNPLEGQTAIRHKVEMRKMRFEIAPQLMMSINQDFKHFVGGGLVLQFHVADWLGIGVQFAGGGSVNSGITGKLIGDGEVTDPKNGGALGVQQVGVQPSRQQFLDHLASIQALFSAYAAVTPFAGKMALFGALFLKYDLYGMMGVGGLYLANSFDQGKNGGASHARECSDKATATDPNSCDPVNSGLKFGGMFGVGLHLYFNNWVGLNLELRDMLASSNPGGLDVNGDRKVTGDDESIQNNFFFSLGLTLMLPPTAKISP